MTRRASTRQLDLEKAGPAQMLKTLGKKAATARPSQSPVHQDLTSACENCLKQGKVVIMDFKQAELYQRRWAAIRSAQLDESSLEKHTRFSWKRTLELIEFAASLHGWPLPESEVSRHQNEDLRRKWAVLNAKAKAKAEKRDAERRTQRVG